ncbi:MAG TPA: hypothetical protein VIN10_05280 [Bacteroidales bacterium]
MNEAKNIAWLLEGDVAKQYQVHRDLLGNDRKDLQNRISSEGWGKHFLSKPRSRAIVSRGPWPRGGQNEMPKL